MIGAWHSAPTSLRATFLLFSAAGIWVIGSAVVLLVIGLNAVGSARSGVNQFGDVAGQHGAGDFVLGKIAGVYGPMFVALAVVLLFLSLLVCACYVTLGWLALAGRNAPRVIASVLAGFSLFGLLAGPLTLIWVGLGVAGVVCSWLPSSNAYVREQAKLRHREPVSIGAGR